MRNRFLITVTDVDGAKHYSFHQIIKKILLYIFLSLVLLFVLGALSIKYLMYELQSIAQKRDAIENEYNIMLDKNLDLTNDIKMKTEELIIISDKIEDLEGIVGIGDTSPQAELTLAQRVDIASITGAQKRTVLQILPNGAPIEDVYVTSNYGTRIHPVTKKREIHAGIDFRAAIGTPVYATADGVVDFSMRGYGGGYGNMVKITHAFGFKTIFAHLSKIKVNKGDFVKKGDIIALSGNSGLSSGPHLHYEIRFIGQHLNPRPFVNWNLKNYTEIFDKEKSIKWQSLLATINRLMDIQAPLSSQLEQKLTAQ